MTGRTAGHRVFRVWTAGVHEQGTSSRVGGWASCVHLPSTEEVSSVHTPPACRPPLSTGLSTDVNIRPTAVSAGCRGSVVSVRGCVAGYTHPRTADSGARDRAEACGCRLGALWMTPAGGAGRSAAVLLLDAVGQLGHLVVDAAALGHELADLAIGVHDRGVVPAAERLPDFRQRELCELAAQVHRDLPGSHEDAGARRSAEVFDAEAE